MLLLDSATLLFAGALVTVMCSVYFVVNTAFGVNDRAGRIWTVAFVAGMIVTGAYIVWALDPAAWWAVAVGNGMFALTGGMFWAGTRAFNGRRPLAVYVALAALAVAGFAVLRRDVTQGWGGTVELFAAVVVFAALAAVEMMRGAGRGNLNARIFSAVMGLAALVYLVRMVALIGLGATDPLFTAWFGTGVSTSVFIVLTFCASVTLTVLRTQMTPRSAHHHDAGGLLTVSAFDTLARGWLIRADAEDRGMALAEIRLHGLQDIGVAFGSLSRARVIDDFVAVVTATMPALSLPARLADDRLVVLFPATDAPAARSQVQRIAAAAEARSGDSTGIPLTIAISLAHSDAVGYGMDALRGEVATHRTMVMTTGLTGDAV